MDTSESNFCATIVADSHRRVHIHERQKVTAKHKESDLKIEESEGGLALILVILSLRVYKRGVQTLQQRGVGAV